jgi:hypothetical protein
MEPRRDRDHRRARVARRRDERALLRTRVTVDFRDARADLVDLVRVGVGERGALDVVTQRLPGARVERAVSALDERGERGVGGGADERDRRRALDAGKRRGVVVGAARGVRERKRA